MNDKIKDWYLQTYPSDELGETLYEKNTFYDLFEALDSYQEMHTFLGSEYDSLVRERIFAELALRMEVDYDYIYDQWMMGTDRRMRQRIVNNVNT